MRFPLTPLLMLGLSAAVCQASVITFGDADCLGTGCYGASDPTAGATLQGLSAGVITLATNSLGHTYPFLRAPASFLEPIKSMWGPRRPVATTVIPSVGASTCLRL